jgi:hypothetical protein
MDKVAKQSYEKALAENDNDKQSEILEIAKNEVYKMVDRIAKEAAQKQGKKFGVGGGAGRVEIKIRTDPPSGKVYIMSDMQKVFAEMRGKDIKKEIINYAISSGVTDREGLIWYYIEWQNGTTSGPTSTKIITKVVVLK